MYYCVVLLIQSSIYYYITYRNNIFVSVNCCEFQYYCVVLLIQSSIYYYITYRNNIFVSVNCCECLCEIN